MSVPGRLGNPDNAFEFNGSDSYIDLTTDFDYPERTICVWFKVNNFTNPPGVIYNSDHSSLNYGLTFLHVTNQNGINTIKYNFGGQPKTYLINQNQWYFAAISISSSQAIYYLNCEPLDTLNYSTSSSTDGQASAFLGKGRFPNYNLFNGVIDDVQIYDCALSQEEIEQVSELSCNEDTTVCCSDTLGAGWEELSDSVIFYQRNNHASVVHNNEFYIMGGYNGSSSLNDVWKSSDGINWTQLTSNAQWSQRGALEAVSFSGKIWLTGGSVGSTQPNEVWSSADGINWTLENNNTGWDTRSGFGMVTHNNKIWVFGGRDYSGNFYNDVWSSADGINWTQVNSSANWVPRQGLSEVVHDGNIWVIGGLVNSTTSIADAWYSNDGITWTNAYNSGIMALNNSAALSYNNMLWLIGGSTTNDYNGTLNKVWNSGDGETWNVVANNNCWLPRFNHTVNLFKNKFFLIGGRDINGNWVNETWKTNSCTIDSLPQSSNCKIEGDLEYENLQNICISDKMELSFNSSVNYNYSWTISDTIISQNNDLQITINQTETEVKLLVNNWVDSCSKSFETLIFAEDCTTPDTLPTTTSVPNIITPNNNGINEYFEIKGYASPIKLLIYNRWGKQVYHNDNYQNNWNATGLNDGLYFYQFVDGENNQHKGWVQVRR